MAATVPGASTLGLSKEHKQGFKKVLGIMPEQNDKELYAIFRADTLNRFYVPAVMMGHDQPAPPSAQTVHILGSDGRSKFLSHSLHGVYGSIQTIDPYRTNKYTNIVRNRSRRQGSEELVRLRVANGEAHTSEVHEQEGDKGHISNLVVSGPPSQTVKLLEQVKDRVDGRTAICLMQDGLGVAEAASNKVFTDPKNRPSIVLGHMTHSLALDRNANAVHSMKPDYQTALTGIRPYLGKKYQGLERRHQHQQGPATATESWLRTQDMLSKFAAATDLHAHGVPLDQWLRLKIPSLMFSAVADPICVLLDARYDQLLWNPTATRLIGQLLDEIADVVALMPELRNASTALQAALRGEGMRKHTINRLKAKRDAPSRMALQIQRGQLTDIDYLNGYFIERGKRLGVKLPANEMVVGMVKAKHKARLEKLRSYVPFEMTSRFY
ncbi:6-phosphogluconate dehydrogenase C-terminal domain-like protein [Sodiomyces alkalinus F11]|uniref:6-phosphogluconate dehydrogenase C-terminal domain-like protein n=1 Tax=Sodiomyces alkalinus (strain CBS 110278 / VKM F-3762 / F11) TaxID=1314773 RepID=A0A3N2PT24_SODAK|nr:6-phosphogluconate dehydrogenase C-terminal domain-like protein [Sodiomyces alkalinus F11]ROT37672.1 6-phosphogluconate dehydrogenase C-terminal domain-like protein [Sodiomyces alkalinus F11]